MSFNIKQAMLKRGEKHRENLIIFLSGAGVFFLGMLIIFSMSSQDPSIKQEIAVVIGLGLVCIGGAIAAFGYFCLSFLRLYRWFQK